MRPRTAGKIIAGSLTLAGIILAIIYAFNVEEMEKDFDHAVCAIVFAILSLTTATCYRYFED